MIVVRAELKSAISSSRDTQLCEMHIVNDGTGSSTRGNYDVALFGRNGRRIRTARIENYARSALPAWRLIAAAFAALEGD